MFSLAVPPDLKYIRYIEEFVTQFEVVSRADINGVRNIYETTLRIAFLRVQI